MPSHSSLYRYLSDGISFVSQKATHYRKIYFPLCGPAADSIKSSITPFLGGDIKIDKDRFLTKPVSSEDLRNNLRNFFVYIDGNTILSLTEETQKDSASVEIGQLWHKLVRKHKAGLELEALHFVPVTGENVELMKVTVKNVSSGSKSFIPTVSIPIFGRSLENKHDHEHVTSLFNRTEQLPEGVFLKPVMLFDEKGHKENETAYYVFGVSDQGEVPEGSFPTVESFYGEYGTFQRPQAVVENLPPRVLPKERIDGKETVGALRFKEESLGPGQTKSYFMAIGVADGQTQAQDTFKAFSSPQKFDKALEKNKAYWSELSGSIQFQTGDKLFNSWMRWVTIQPVLRRIYGCSFLPEHDYGKGGKGWRDIWQDLLSLILIEPEHVRGDLINNFAGVRIDGSNATIIEHGNNKFLADRNMITRVWMDHGVWPLATLLFYVNQTGDFDILLEETTYFRDPQMSRTFEKDPSWEDGNGNQLRDKKEKPYKGSVIEHVLIENLVQFFNVGEHNITRLENADWNDGFDMAFDRGESVAFMSFYGGNLLVLADLLENLRKTKDVKEISLGKEVLVLLDSLSGKGIDYENPQVKKNLLFQSYFKSVQPQVSGEQVMVKIEDIVKDLKRKGNWIFEHIRKNEKITEKIDGHSYSWFNGYYDNKGQCLEGLIEKAPRMTLTGQTFPIMSGLATEEEIGDVVKSVDQFLKDKTLGGIRLNTDFGLSHYLDMGRTFGFVFGTKENGAFFSHMTVMYAYALYKRGFVREGHKVLRSIFSMCMSTDKSKIYPGIPEYFDPEGQGMYHYLTGSASWLILTELTQVFGVVGENGDLTLAPKLVKEEFGDDGKASVNCQFAQRRLNVTYENQKGLDFGQYEIKEVQLNGQSIDFEKISPNKVKIKRDIITQGASDCSILVVLT